MKGMLIRVGADNTYGEWNAPVNPVTGDFVYIPIPEENAINHGQNFPYDHFISDLNKFCMRNNLNEKMALKFPKHLHGKNTHLDPDFNFLTYGDNGDRRGKELKTEFDKGDFIVFYAGLKPIISFSDPLYYAIIGFYEIEKVFQAKDIPEEDSIINAHTRLISPNPNDVVITANPTKSGRLKKCLLIGEYRDKSYRIEKRLLNEWGDISSNNGYLQRSIVPPTFKEPGKFLNWFTKQNIELVQRNNL